LFGVDQDAEVELDVVHPYANMNGLIPLVETRVKVEKGTLSITKLVLKQPFVDFWDFADKLIKAELSVDPPGVKITTPTIPCRLRDTNKVKVMFARDVNHCEEEEEAHKVLCTSLQSNNALTPRELLYTFPDNFMCSNSYFNDDNPDPLKLQVWAWSTAPRCGHGAPHRGVGVEHRTKVWAWITAPRCELFHMLQFSITLLIHDCIFFSVFKKTCFLC
jgi:hypothetical protein